MEWNDSHSSDLRIPEGRDVLVLQGRVSPEPVHMSDDPNRPVTDQKPQRGTKEPEVTKL
jgi:hypothetical protein